MARVETPDKAPPLNNNINLFGLTDEQCQALLNSQSSWKILGSHNDFTFAQTRFGGIVIKQIEGRIVEITRVVSTTWRPDGV